MDRANYLSTSVAGGGSGRYPLSTQGLDFIQNQILLLEALARLGGMRYMLVRPTAGRDGVIVVDGEVMPMRACTLPENAPGVIRVVTEDRDIVAQGVTYAGARTVRWAEYVPVVMSRPYLPPIYDLADFPVLRSLREMTEGGV